MLGSWRRGRWRARCGICPARSLVSGGEGEKWKCAVGVVPFSWRVLLRRRRWSGRGVAGCTLGVVPVTCGRKKRRRSGSGVSGLSTRARGFFGCCAEVQRAGDQDAEFGDHDLQVASFVLVGVRLRCQPKSLRGNSRLGAPPCQGNGVLFGAEFTLPFQLALVATAFREEVPHGRAHFSFAVRAPRFAARPSVDEAVPGGGSHRASPESAQLLLRGPS